MQAQKCFKFSIRAKVSQISVKFLRQLMLLKWSHHLSVGKAGEKFLGWLSLLKLSCQLNVFKIWGTLTRSYNFATIHTKEPQIILRDDFPEITLLSYCVWNFESIWVRIYSVRNSVHVYDIVLNPTCSNTAAHTNTASNNYLHLCFVPKTYTASIIKWDDS